MNLIDNANQWLRLWSMRWAVTTAFLAAIPAAYIMLPADWLPAIPQWIKSSLALATLFSAGATGVARMLSRRTSRPHDRAHCPARWRPRHGVRIGTAGRARVGQRADAPRSEEHTSEIQSLMRNP